MESFEELYTIFQQSNVEISPETLWNYIQCCLEKSEKEWMVLLSTMVFDRSKFLTETQLLQLLEKVQKSQHKRLALIVFGHVSVGQKNLVVLNRIVEFVKGSILKGELLAQAFKSLHFIIQQNQKIANQVIDTLLMTMYPYLYTNSKRVIQIDSDSEYSDVDLKRNRSEKVQEQILLCLEALARQSPKQMNGQWAKLLPPSTPIDQSLVRFLQSPSVDCRTAACRVLQAMFTNSSKYCSIAEHGTSRSFTSLSQLLSDMICSTLEFVVKSIKNEDNKFILQQLLITLCSILRNVPIKSLDPRTVRLVFGLLSVRLQTPTEDTSLLLDCLSALIEPMESSSSNEIISFSVQTAIPYSSSKDINTKISCLGLVTSLCVHSAALIWQNWNSFQELVFGSLQSEEGVCLAAVKALEQLVHSLITSEIELSTEWWKLVLERVALIWHHEFFAIRTVCCQLISHIPFVSFEPFPEKLKNLLRSTCLTYANDEHVEVKSSGCGAIGSFVANGNFHDHADLEELIDRLVPLCRDEALKVRIRAFWALGNVIDKMINGNKQIISDEKMLPLLQVTVDGCSDNEKVRYHALRTLGFLAELLRPSFLKRSVVLLSQVIDVLLKNITSGSFKVRWNACHCLKHMLSNSGFPIGTDVPYTQNIFDTLCKAITQTQNFKVKIAAILALSTPTTVIAYQSREKSSKENVLAILGSFVSAIERIDQTISKSSYEDQKYLAQFSDVMTNAVGHLKSIDWDDTAHELEARVLELMNGVLTTKSTFDSTGI